MSYFKTNLFKLLALCLFAGTIMVGCQPQNNVVPNSSSSPSMAFSGPGDTVHVDPNPVCGVPQRGDITDSLGRLGSGNFFGADTYGKYELITTDDEVYLQVTASRGWFVKRYFVYMGEPANIPKQGNGNADLESFPVKGVVTPARNIWEVKWPKDSAYLCPSNSVVVVVMKLVEIDFLGNPFNETLVSLDGTPIGTGSANQVSYCAASCIPPCEVPTPMPGDDLTKFECGNGNQTKVTVCHLPPGNPANMREICISTAALPAHIIDYKPANNPCMGHHSGCHIGPCDPCGPGSTADFVAEDYDDPCPGNGGNNNNGNGNGRS